MERGEWGRLELELGGNISAGGAARGVKERSSLPARVRCKVWPPSRKDSGNEPSFDNWELNVDCLEDAAEFVGVGDLGILLDGIGFSATGLDKGDSTGEGSLWMTLRRSLLVRIAADWIIGTWCARLGKIAGMRRGVNGTMTSSAKLRNSANQRKAVDCWISSS